MPLPTSGAALYAGPANEFVKMAPESSLTAHVTREFNRRWGTATESEIRSWKNSLTALARVVEAAELGHSGVGVELKLPFTNKRIDCSFVARDASGQAQVRIVELKQWSAAAPSTYPDNVVVGAKEMLHPSVQAAAYASYLRDSHSAFTEDGFGLASCAYLHNMSADDAKSLRGLQYAGAISEAPFFINSDTDQFAEYLQSGLSGGGGMEILRSVTEGRYSPSKTLMAGIAKGLADNPLWTLLDEQRVAFNIVRGLVERALKTGEKGVVVVRGGPGTGKSVIAAHLLVALAKQEGVTAAHATGSKAFTTNLRAISPNTRAAAAVFRYFNNFAHKQTPENGLDVLLCDEAHRMRADSNSQYTKRALRSEMSQVAELIRAAKVSVFLLDERQNVRVDEVGTVASIRAAAQEMNIRVEDLSLSGQFRCSGCAGYIDWVDALMSANPVPPGPWLGAGEYAIELLGDPASLEAKILSQTKKGHTARIVAGFCWPWSDPNEDGSLVDDVVIGDWQRPWNEKSPEQQKKAGTMPVATKHPYYRWTTEPARVREIGCIYSAQGFEFDYCGVILGNDLVWRDGIGWVASREASHDASIRRRKLAPEQMTALLHHTYRVLLTRGMKGTYIYSTDAETRMYLDSLLGQAAAATEAPPSSDKASDGPAPVTALVAVDDLLEPLRGELIAWRSSATRDPDTLNRIVARNYGALGPYTSAQFHAKAGEADMLEVQFRPGPGIDPAAGKAHYLRGLGAAELGKLEEALNAFASAVAADPLVAMYNAAHGHAALELKRPEEAERSLLLSLSLAPKEWEALTMLGNVYHWTKKLDLALKMQEAAVGAQANEHTLTNLGAVLGERGEYSEARDAFRLALKYNKAHRRAQLGLAMCEQALNDGKESP
jgi:tetratricopeptide (TPR) repeat protein